MTHPAHLLYRSSTRHSLFLLRRNITYRNKINPNPLINVRCAEEGVGDIGSSNPSFVTRSHGGRYTYRCAVTWPEKYVTDPSLPSYAAYATERGREELARADH